jgi:phosphoadenosine phosphosulfate reductase
MNRAITQLSAQAWLSGLRRVQSNSREKRPAIEQQNKIVKLYPIIDWSDKAIYDYLTQHDLPYHPLWDQGYVSVGDWHSTSKLSAGMRAEDTRFGGLKRECGLHESSEGDNYQI